jgi:hypothetical protein
VEKPAIHRLLIAEVGAQVGEHRHRAPLARQHRQPRVRERHGEADRLQEHRLPAHVRAGDQQQPGLLTQLEIQRHGLHHGLHHALAFGSGGRVARTLGNGALLRHREQRVSRAHQPQRVAAGRDRHTAQLHRPQRARTQRVQRRERVLERLQLGRGRAHGSPQLAQDAAFFRRGFAAKLDEPVVGVGRFERLHEQRLPAVRAVVHDRRLARHARRGHQRHEAITRSRHVAVAVAVRRRPALELLVQPALALGDRLASARERARRAVLHAPVGIECGRDLPLQGFERRQRAGELREPREALGEVFARPRLARALARIQPVRDDREVGGLERLVHLGGEHLGERAGHGETPGLGLALAADRFGETLGGRFTARRLRDRHRVTQRLLGARTHGALGDRGRDAREFYQLE